METPDGEIIAIPPMRIRDLLFSLTVVTGLFLSPEAGAESALQAAWLAGPKLDGVWKTGEWTGASAAVLSAAGRPEKPEVRVIETSGGLYFGILMRDNSLVFGRSPRGGSLHQEDVLEIFFELRGDARRYAEFQISRSGEVFYKSYFLQAEAEVTSTGRLTPEFLERYFVESIRPVPQGIRWASGSSAGRWVAEVFLPRRLLGSKVRANFAVHDWDRALGTTDRKGRFYYWTAVEPGCPHISPSRFGFVFLNL